MDEDEEMPATLEDPAADEEETRALVEAFEAEQAAQAAQVLPTPPGSFPCHRDAPSSSRPALCHLATCDARARVGSGWLGLVRV